MMHPAQKLTTIPTEVLQEILGWTDPETDLIKCLTLCKSLRARLSNPQFLAANFKDHVRRYMAVAGYFFDRESNEVASQQLQNMDQRWFRWPRIYQEVYARQKLHGATEINWSRVYCGYKNGLIPDAVGLVGRGLQILNLSAISVSGPLPDAIADLQGLRELDLSQNLLTGPFPDLGNLSQLIRLDLSRNKLSGMLPDSLARLTELQSINLNNNKLSGPLPRKAFVAWTQLEILHLEVNEFSGDIPDELASLQSLRIFCARNNKLEGCIPAVIGQLGETLVALDISNNNLAGSIPTQISQLHQLEHFSCSYNHINGPLPPEVWDLTRLRSLHMKNNQLTGPLSAKVGGLRDLSAFSLANNFFTGPIPAELADCNLCHLQLSHNAFEGSIPAALEALKDSVGYFDFSNNRLRGYECAKGKGRCFGNGRALAHAVWVSNSRLPRWLLGSLAWMNGLFSFTLFGIMPGDF